MAVRKKHLFKEDVRELGEYGQALGHPARVQILEVLALHGRCSFASITASIPLSDTTVAFHCRVLKDAGWMEHCSLGNGEGGYQICQAAVEVALVDIKAFCSRLVIGEAA